MDAGESAVNFNISDMEDALREVEGANSTSNPEDSQVQRRKIETYKERGAEGERQGWRLSERNGGRGWEGKRLTDE